MLRESHDQQTSTIFTAVDYDKTSLLVIPLAWARADLAAYATLLNATTFGAARLDENAASLVEEYLSAYLEERDGYDDDGEPRTGADDEPFDAESFFGEDHQSAWRPDARRATAGFLEQNESEVAAVFLRPDDGWGFDYEQCSFVPVERRGELEAELRRLGYLVGQWQRLPELYGKPGTDPAAELSAAASAPGDADVV